MNLKMSQTKYLLLNLLIILAFLFSMIFMFTIIQEKAQDNIKQKINNKLMDIKTSISQTLVQSIDELRAASAILIFVPDVSEQQFKNYAKKQIRHQSKDFILEWQPIVLDKDREIFERKAREQGMENFRLWEPDKNGNAIPAIKKEEYVPVYYMLSHHADINTLGIDLAWSPERMLSKYSARDNGVAKASELFKVVTNKKKDYAPIGFAITFPVYKGGLIPESFEGRQNNILGYLAGVYSIPSLFQDLLKNISKEKLAFSIHSKNHKELVFYQNNWKNTSYTTSTTIDVYGTQWKISLEASESYLQANQPNIPFYLLAIQFVLGITIIVILNILYKKNNDLETVNKKLEKFLVKVKKSEEHHIELSKIDPLTGLFNRRAFFETFEKMIIETQLSNDTLICALIDIDKFKEFNDTLGHDIGDEILKKFSEICQSTLRDNDVIARYGGDEFIILYKHTEFDEAIEVSNRLRKKVEDMKIDTPNKIDIKITISTGLALYREKDLVSDVIKRADESLYRAKKNGRNRVEYLS